MAWISPRVWVNDELVDASDLNEVSDSLRYLLKPNGFEVIKYGAGATGVAAAAAGTWQNLPGFTGQITTQGGRVLICANLRLYTTGYSDGAHIGVGVDSDPVVYFGGGVNAATTNTILHVFPSLTAGLHTFQLKIMGLRSDVGYSIDHSVVARLWGMEL